jgi:hypothetical protein
MRNLVEKINIRKKFSENNRTVDTENGNLSQVYHRHPLAERDSSHYRAYPESSPLPPLAFVLDSLQKIQA